MVSGCQCVDCSSANMQQTQHVNNWAIPQLLRIVKMLGKW